VLANRVELEQTLRRPGGLGPVFARHAYGMRRWVELFGARLPTVSDPYLTELLAQLVAWNARHARLFRERAVAHGVNPDLYVCPPEGEVIYDTLAPLDGEDALAYALGSLEHFADLLAVYHGAAQLRADREVLAEVRGDNERAIAALRSIVARPDSPAAADAHELYRVRELAETPLYALAG
jgi:hypothetical protein